MVLRTRERKNVITVNDCDEARLLAGEKLFDDNLCASIAKLTLVEHVPDRRFSLIDAVRYYHPFSRSQTVSLHH